MSTEAITTRMLGRYELLFLLGQGGMGEVHLAKLSGAGGFEKLCIVKTILPQMKAEQQFVDRFHHEARVLVQLNHSNIAQVYDMGETDGTLYMAIEYVPGVDASRVQSRVAAAQANMPLPIALYLGRHLSEALGYAHRKTGPDGTALGIVHRDVSPQNMMVSYEGEVKVIDFGLAKSAARSKHTLPSTVMGKLGYMSPEQATAKPVDHRSDIYSAGIVVWELIAGRPVFQGGTMGEMVAMMANPTIPSLRSVRPEVSAALDAVVLKALEREPDGRYQRCDDFARALNELAVREGLNAGAEEVGNYVRAMCPDEFAAERQLQSKLSILRKRGSGNLATPNPSGMVEGTFVRPSSPEMKALTPAQRAASVLTQPEQGSTGSNAAHAPTPSLAAQMNAVAPSRTGLYVGVAIVLAAVIGAGAFLLSRPAQPVATTPPVETPEPAKPSPVAVVAPTKPAEEPSPEPEATGPAVKRERAQPSMVFRVIHKGDSAFLVLEAGTQIAVGERLRLVGPPLDGTSREIVGSAAVLELKGSLAELVLDEDDGPTPKELFAFRDATAQVKPHPKRQPVASAKPKPAAETTVAPAPAEKPAEKPAERPAEQVAPAPAAKPAEAAPERPKQRIILGDVKLQRRRNPSDIFGGVSRSVVLISTREKDTLTNCLLWLPNGMSYTFGSLEAGRDSTAQLELFRNDPRPLDATMRSGSYALVQCREGAGYFYYTTALR